MVIYLVREIDQICDFFEPQKPKAYYKLEDAIVEMQKRVQEYSNDWYFDIEDCKCWNEETCIDFLDDEYDETATAGFSLFIQEITIQ